MATRNENIRLTISAKDRSSRVLSGIQSKVVGIGMAYLSWRSVTGVIKNVVELGVKHELVVNDLTAALQRHRREIDNNIKRIAAFADQMQTMSGISDEIVMQAVQRFIDYGLTVDEAMRTVRVAMDMSAGTGQQFLSVVELLAKAAVGYTSTLSRYGIIVDENIPKTEKFAAAVKQINDRFGGAAAARMNQTATQLDVLGQRFGDLQEKIYTLIEPVLKTAVVGISAVVDWFVKNFDRLTGRVSEFFTILWEQVQDTIKVFKDTAAVFEAFFSFDFGKIAATSAIAMNTIETTIQNGTNRLGRIWKMYTTDTLNLWKDFWANIGIELGKSEAKLTPQIEETITSLTNWQDKLMTQPGQRGLVLEPPRIDTSQAEVDWYRWSVEHNRIVEETLNTTEDAWNDTYQVMASSAASFAYALTGDFQDVENKLKNIFIRIAQDFISLFIRESLSQTEAEFVSPFLRLLALFDKSANDRMAMIQGERYARFFSEGALSQLQSVNLAARIAGTSPILATGVGDVSGIAPGRSTLVNVTFNINAPVTSDAFSTLVEKDVTTILEKASERNISRIELKPYFETSSSIYGGSN
jgi:hypothetical protein